MSGDPDEVRVNALTDTVIGAARQIHTALGPGLLESAYEACLAFELSERKLRVEQQRPLPIRYKGAQLDCEYRIDLVVADRVIVEIKAVEAVEPVHKAQLLSYLRLADMRVGLLINFHVQLLRNGIYRVVNNFK